LTASAAALIFVATTLEIRVPHDEPSSLRDLIARAQAGDSQALSELVTLHEPMLARWARRRLGYPLRTLDETRDIIHDCYTVVLRKIGQFRYEDSTSFARWLRGIVTRIVLQKAGGVDIKRRLAMPEEPNAADSASTPSTAAALSELVRYRYAVLREFDRTDRFIYRLRLRGFSSQQISELCGMTDRGVRLRFARTDARIRMRMGGFIEGRVHGGV
jgi:RNA polymerase sigma factor (sigma-70 family)